MFTREFLDLCYEKTITKRFITAVVSAAIGLGLILPLILSFISLFGNQAKLIARGLSLFQYSGVYPNLFSFISGDVPFAGIFFSSVSVPLILYAILLHRIRLPFIPLWMIGDLLAGRIITVKKFAENTPITQSFPALEWAGIFVFLLLLIAFFYAFAGSVMLIANFLEYRRFNKLIG